jgi:hypothetical protein
VGRGKRALHVDGSTRPRAPLALGDPLPLPPEYLDRKVPALRRGVATATWDSVEPLPPNHGHKFIAWKDDGN